jgi:coproporphyrinogen III oxidase-like Fe-S oxidoreductase
MKKQSAKTQLNNTLGVGSTPEPDKTPSRKLQEKLGFYRSVTEKHGLISPYTSISRDGGELCSHDGVRELWGMFLAKRPSPFLSLYVHVPYCFTSKCKYCTYRSRIVRDESELEGYLDYLLESVRSYSSIFAEHPFSTLHVGGGTPTLLCAGQLDRLFAEINGSFDFMADRSFALEIKPTKTGRDQIETAAKHGCNRISIGVQSFNEKALKLACRKYASPIEIKLLVDCIRDTCGGEINIDIIGGLPGDTPADFKNSFRIAMEMPVTTITIYFFRPENSIYSEKTREKHISYYKRNYEIQFLEGLDDIAKEHGFAGINSNPHFNYQVFVNESFHGEIEKHKTNWTPKKSNSLLGIGVGARSFILNIADIVDFGPRGFGAADISSALEPPVKQPQASKYYVNLFSEMVRIRDYVLKEFHSSGSVSLEEFKSLFRKDFESVFGEEVKALTGMGRMATADGRVYLLCDGFERAVHLKFFYDQEKLAVLSNRPPQKEYVTF